MTDRVSAEANRLGHDKIRPADALTAIERELLLLLAAGATHQTAAYRLGIPLRTARRRIANLTKQLGAISPFQAGAEAARRGWLAEPHDSKGDPSRRNGTPIEAIDDPAQPDQQAEINANQRRAPR